MSDDPTIEPTGDPVIDALLGQREAAVPERRRRTGGHAAAGERSRLPPQRPWAQPRLRYAPTEVVSADELESIHLASLRVLEEIGMDFLDAEARALLKTAGADVREGSERVRFDRGMVLERIVTAPPSFTLHATNPAHDLVIGGDWIAFGSVASAPNVNDLDRGRRVGNRADYQDLIRLSQMLDVVHFFAGYPVEPVDIHPSVRHLHAIHDLLTLADKAIHCYSLGRQRNRDAHRDGAPRARHRRRDPRARAVGLHGHQLELAAPARHADAPGHPRDVGAEPGHRDDARSRSPGRWRR